jgi:hypothetical protein
MGPSAIDASSTLLAYFSHSYHSSEKDINLFFWELLSKHHLYFTVDSEENRNRPMDITYLEWMMRRSACFVAVIPRRDDVLPFSCSPYQVFENGLAVRARKPRLIFVEEGLDETIFGVQPDEVYSFRRAKHWLEEDKGRFAQAAERLASRAHAFASQDSGLRKPVILLADTRQGTAYDAKVIRSIRQAVRDQGYSFQTLNPSDFDHDFLFLQAAGRCSVLLSEVRPPHMASDVFGLIHDRCIPTVRICHLEKNEEIDRVHAAMHLSYDESRWTDQDQGLWPLILGKYQIDNHMEPVIFWRNAEELAKKIGACLQKITGKRRDLITEQEARDYFLGIGRLPGRVFISNAKALNDFAERLKGGLRRNAVAWFHYKDKDAIDIGASNWLSEVIREIRNSVVFVALLDSNYEESPWCTSELNEALQQFRKDEIEIHAYVMDSSIELPPGLSMMQLDFVETLEESDRVNRMVGRVVQFLEKGKRVNLRSKDRDRFTRLLVTLPSFASPNERKTLLRDARLPASVIEQVRTETPSIDIAVAEMIDDLVAWEEELKPYTKALGLLLSHVIGLVSPEDQVLLADIIRGYWLMPDIRRQMSPYAPLQEVGLAYLHEQQEMGTFVSIRKGALVGQNLKHGELGANLFALSVKAAAEESDWQTTLRIAGSEIVHSETFRELLGNQARILESGVRRDQIGFCFCTDIPGLRIPFEWAVPEEQSAPLCLSHPVRRFLAKSSEPRPTLRMLLDGEAAVPLRVLLVASDTGGIPEVENETEEIYSLFCDLFDQVGWPRSNVCKIGTRLATASRVEKEIKFGHYHLLHFAGHGGYEDGKSVLAVYNSADLQQTSLITSTMLRNWIADSDLRFVYLSSCRSASTEIPEFSAEIHRFENMVHTIAEARVPEMIGFIWPISDLESKALAQRFYRGFLSNFDANLALYHARISFEEESRIWTAPILIQQTDTRPI